MTGQGRMTRSSSISAVGAAYTAPNKATKKRRNLDCILTWVVLYLGFRGMKRVHIYTSLLLDDGEISSGARGNKGKDCAGAIRADGAPGIITVWRPKHSIHQFDEALISPDAVIFSS